MVEEAILNSILPYNEEDSCIVVLYDGFQSLVFMIELSTDMAAKIMYKEMMCIEFKDDHSVIEIRKTKDKYTAYLLMITDKDKDINLNF